MNHSNCSQIIFSFGIIILLLLIYFLCNKNKFEPFSNIESKNNLNDLDHLFDYKEFKKNMENKCNVVTNKHNELNKILNSECNDNLLLNNPNNKLKCRTYEDSNLALIENKKNYCLFNNNNNNNNDNSQMTTLPNNNNDNSQMTTLPNNNKNIEGFMNNNYYHY